MEPKTNPAVNLAKKTASWFKGLITNYQDNQKPLLNPLGTPDPFLAKGYVKTGPNSYSFPQQNTQGQVLGTQTPDAQEAIKRIKKGFETYGNPPVSGLAEYMVQESMKYPQLAKNPWIIPAIALKETGGGKNMKFSNNPLNWGIYEKSFQPKSMEEVIERATSGIGKRMGAYQDFRNSGEAKDIIKRYAPPSENDTQKYIEDMEYFRKMFGY
jgi:hypothetical protein